MGKIEKYATIITELLKDFERPDSYIETYLIKDVEQHHYQVLRMGWVDKDTQVIRIVVYLQIKPDGKIWLQANWTEHDIVDTLMEKGVDKNDIVLGLLPESVRPYSGFAVN